MADKKHIVILGGGFAGLKLSRTLNNNPHYNVTLIDKHNFHQFQPLFYQVATASLEASSISFPLRKIFQNSKNVRIRIANVNKIDTDTQTVKTDVGDVTYDYLVIATGADTNYFGNEELRRNACPMKTTVEAMQLRNHIIQNLEAASVAKNPDDLQRHLNIIVVGGGPTGVELSGALAEMKRYILPKDYPELDVSRMNIFLIESSPNTLASMSATASATSRQYLEKMGVEIHTGNAVKAYDGKKVLLRDGSTMPAGLVIWAAGVKGNVPGGIDPALITPANRIRVDSYNRVNGFTNVFAVGDIAFMEHPNFPKGLPQLASVALAQAAHLAHNLKTVARQRTNFKAFHYEHKGSMATVGRNKAVVDINNPKISFNGAFAWLIWMSVHLFLLMGFKNRMLVFINWAYKYLTFDQSLRLIFGVTTKPAPAATTTSPVAAAPAPAPVLT